MHGAILPIVDLHKFAEPTWVVVVHCLGVAESLYCPTIWYIALTRLLPNSNTNVQNDQAAKIKNGNNQV